ncbi:Aste57867_20136 [Aphanomyces stellatus]|uniref:Aste57867_20136 protein n=1 Tax=Aphanomyces stellatus TaxID=120398 RepID=A0A485LFH3_9STRA|nr:hypothetical protein As57867_020070 [Aphanomyces stellatus]VFT96831.1 Aste57867_20136 [Aphanomyces stellatus]
MSAAATSQRTDGDEAAYETTYVESDLPEGWTKIVHRSGLICFLHDLSGVVAWSKPYVVSTDHAVVQGHRPPLEIFAEGCGMKQPDANRPVKVVQADAIIRRLGHASSRPSAADGGSADVEENSLDAALPPSRKRPLQDDDDDAASAAPDVIPSSNGDTERMPQHVAPPRARILVNGVSVEDPAGKTAMAFLMDYTKEWAKTQPEYVQTLSNGGSVHLASVNPSAVDPTMPYECTVLINNQDYGHGMHTTKQLARQRAAEVALEALLPGYWAKLKEAGAIRKVSNLAVASEFGKSPPITEAAFEALTMQDPRVLQGCMDLGFKTPAQLLTEYQTKHRGISVVYNTVTQAAPECLKFKVVASAGPETAEGLAGNKKLAKQYAAQALLARLNPHVRTYHELMMIHENSVKQHGENVNRNKIQKLTAKFGAATRPPVDHSQAALLPPPAMSGARHGGGRGGGRGGGANGYSGRGGGYGPHGGGGQDLYAPQYAQPPPHQGYSGVYDRVAPPVYDYNYHAAPPPPPHHVGGPPPQPPTGWQHYGQQPPPRPALPAPYPPTGYGAHARADPRLGGGGYRPPASSTSTSSHVLQLKADLQKTLDRQKTLNY